MMTDQEYDDMDRRLKEATTREGKLAVLRDYMTASCAIEALGVLRGGPGDLIDLTKKKKKKTRRK